MRLHFVAVPVQHSEAAERELDHFLATHRILGIERQLIPLARARWERAFLKGEIDVLGLQAGYDATLSITAHANATAFRRAELGRRPPIDV